MTQPLDTIGLRRKKQKKAHHDKGGRPPAFTTPDLLEEKCNEYFEHCNTATREIYNEKVGVITINVPEPYLILGLCLHIGITRETLNQYSKKAGFSDVVTRVKARCELDTTKRLFDKNQVNGARFLLASKYGYTIKESHEHSGHLTLDDLTSQHKKQTDELAQGQ